MIRPDRSQAEMVSPEAAGWIGFTYRQLHFASGLSSQELAERIPVDRLLIAYPGLHSVDEDMASDIILHDFSINDRRHGRRAGTKRQVFK